MELGTFFDELLKITGLTLQHRVAEDLKRLGWEVYLSPYYIDPVSERPREIDIIARKIFLPLATTPITEISPPKGTKRMVIITLFIECKYIPDNYGYMIWTEEFSYDMHLLRQKNFLNYIKNHGLTRSPHFYKKFNEIGVMFTGGKIQTQQAGKKTSFKEPESRSNKNQRSRDSISIADSSSDAVVVEDSQGFYTGIHQVTQAFSSYQGSLREGMAQRYPDTESIEFKYPLIVVSDLSQFAKIGGSSKVSKPIPVDKTSFLLQHREIEESPNDVIIQVVQEDYFVCALSDIANFHRNTFEIV